MRRKIDTLLAVTVLAVAGIVTSANADTWQGEEVEKDGTLHVMNPAAPVESPTLAKAKQLWEIGGDEEEEFLFGVITQITVGSDGNLYALDSQLNEVMVFSPSGEYLRSIGREGEGPGEFRRPTDMFLTPDGNVAVMQRMPGKIVLLTPDGDPVGDYAVPRPDDDGMQMFTGGRLAGDNAVLMIQSFSRRGDGSGFDFSSTLMAVDAQGNQKASYYTDSAARDFAKLQFDEKEMGRNALTWAVDQNGHVYTSDDFDSYSIRCFTPDGNCARIIAREYQHRTRSDEERERAKPSIRIRRGNRTDTPEVTSSPTDRDIQQMFPRDDGTLWVISSRGGFDAGAGAIATFDVFDSEGRFTDQVTLEGVGDYREDGFFIIGNRLYVVRGLTTAREAMAGGRDDAGAEEELEEDIASMTVIAYDISPLAHTQK